MARKLPEILVDPESYATTLLIAFVDVYGTEGCTWAPAAIKMQIEQDNSIKLPGLALDKLMAAITVISTDYFYRSLPSFIELCNVLAGSNASPGVFDPADVRECAWGIAEATLLDDVPTEREDFIPAIRHYVGAMLDNEGFVTTPAILKKVAAGRRGAANTPDELSDDPSMFAAVWQTQAAHADEVDQLIADNMRELFAQIRELPLRNGDAAAFLQKLPEKLRP